MLRLGHCVLKVQDHDAAVTWFAERLGLIPSDYLCVPGNESRVIGTFLRCDRGERFVDHHSLLVTQADAAGVHHTSFEMQDLDAVMGAHEYLDRAATGSTAASAGTCSGARSSITGAIPSATGSSTTLTATWSIISTARRSSPARPRKRRSGAPSRRSNSSCSADDGGSASRCVAPRTCVWSRARAATPTTGTCRAPRVRSSCGPRTRTQRSVPSTPRPRSLRRACSACSLPPTSRK